MKNPDLPAIGQRIMICGDHSWAGSTGTVTAETRWMGRDAVTVELDNSCGHSAGLTDRRHWKPLPSPAARRTK